MAYSSGSGKNCAIVNCGNNYRKLSRWKKSICDTHSCRKEDCACLLPYRLHSFPKDSDKRQQWANAVNRKDFEPKVYSTVCFLHFVDGKPTKRNPVPQLHLGYESKVVQDRRLLERKPLKEVHQNNENIVEQQIQESTVVPEAVYTAEVISHEVQCQTDPVIVYTPVQTASSSTQTNEEVLEHSYAQTTIIKQYLCKSISTQATSSELSAESINTNADSMFYTGLALPFYKSLLSTLETHGKDLPYKLPVKDQILLTLVRLRLGLLLKDLSQRFGVSVTLASNIFNTWIDSMTTQLKDTIVWLPRDTIQRTLPKTFKESYPKTTIIVDCTEVFIQRPFSLKARAQTYSTYKSHNTVKFLLGIAPSGYIMFLSHSYGGRASDKYITKSSGFLHYLDPGDEVMANRGFTISEDLFALRVKLNIPAFMKGRSQLTDEETTESRRIAAVRIHVERAICRLKSFKILNTTLPIACVKKVDNIARVCAALYNLRGPLIKESD